MEMTFDEWKAGYLDVIDGSAEYETLIEETLEIIWNGPNPKGKAALMAVVEYNAQNETNKKLEIKYVEDEEPWSPDQFSIVIDPTVIQALRFINSTGEIFQATFLNLLLHELLHSQYATGDPNRPDPNSNLIGSPGFDYVGGIVRDTTEILLDIDLSSETRVTYYAAILTDATNTPPADYEVGRDFTNGEMIDVAIAMNPDVDLGAHITENGKVNLLVGTHVGDNFEGSNARDYIWGETGDDNIYSSLGNDHLNGGAGTDNLSMWRNIEHQLTIDLDTPATAGQDAIFTADADQGAWIDTFADFEVLYVDSTLFIANGATLDALNAEQIKINGVTGDGVINASSMDVGVLVDFAAEWFATIGGMVGTVLTGFQDIVGSSFDDVLVGGIGSNNVKGSFGDDFLDGGLHSDTLDYTHINHSFVFSIDPLLGGGEFNTVFNATSIQGGWVDTFTNFEIIELSTYVTNPQELFIDHGATLDALNAEDINIKGGGKDIINASFMDIGVEINFAENEFTTYDGPGISVVGETNGLELTGFASAVGSNFDDLITGNGSDNIIYGSGGADILDGLGGHDDIYGGVGNDVINGGEGADILFDRGPLGPFLEGYDPELYYAEFYGYEGGFDEEGIPLGSDIVDGGVGADKLVYTGGQDIFVGGAGDDSYLVSPEFYDHAVLTDNLRIIVGEDFEDEETWFGHDTIVADGFGISELVLQGLSREDVTIKYQFNTILLDEESGASDNFFLELVGIPGFDLGTYPIYRLEGSMEITVNATGSSIFIQNVFGGQIGGPNSIYSEIFVPARVTSPFDIVFDENSEVSMDDPTANLPGSAVVYTKWINLLAEPGSTWLTSEDVSVAADIASISFDIERGITEPILPEGDGGGTDGDDSLDGTDNGDYLNGGAGDDTINGGDGDDLLMGGTGEDTVDGGAGKDTASYATATDDVRIGLNGEDDPFATEFDTLINIENLQGSDFDDYLTGSDGNNEIYGGDGDDRLIGLEGDDLLVGGAGEDILYAGSGNDILLGGDGNDRLISRDGSDYIDGGAGDDDIYASPGDDIYRGGTGNDTLYLPRDYTSVYSHSVTANLTTGIGHSSFLDSFIMVGIENLVVENTIGDQTLIGNNGANMLTSAAGYDMLDGGGGDDILDAAYGNDVLIGGSGNDILIGGGGDDIIRGGTGIDTARLSSSFDEVTFAWSDEYLEITNAIYGTVYVDLVATDVELFEFLGETYSFADIAILLPPRPNEFLNDVVYGIEGEVQDVDVLANDREALGPEIEVTAIDGQAILSGGIVTLAGGQFVTLNADGTLAIDQNDLYDHLGNGQTETLEIEYTVTHVDGISVTATLEYIIQGRSNVVDGTSGDDILIGTDSADILNGLGGDDEHYGLGGDDILVGNTGADLFDGGSGIDTLDFTYTASDVVIDLSLELMTSVSTGHTESVINIENIISGRGDDILIGDDQDNYLDGDDGDDQHFGGAGNDIISGNLGADSFDGGSGIDTLDFTYTSADVTIDLASELMTATLSGHTEAVVNFERVLSGGGNDIIIGDDNDNFLDGGLGDDEHFGGAGNDTISGNLGADSFDGGSGIDTLDFTYTSADVTIDLASELMTATLSGHTEAVVNFERVLSGGGNDIIIGDDNDNFLDGGLGNDILTGGTGNDVFAFSTEGGSDVISDFNPFEDAIEINGVALDPNNPPADTTIAQVGLDVLISYGQSDAITLTGVDLLIWQDPDQQGNASPVAVDDDISVLEDGTILIDVLANDSDPDGDVLDIISVTQAENGTVSIENNQLRYVPNANFNGNEVLIYEISDRNGGVSSATVTISVTPVNDAPIGFADTLDAVAGEELSIAAAQLLTNDQDIDSTGLLIADFRPVSGEGDLTGDTEALVYLAPEEFEGTVLFEYRTIDPDGALSDWTLVTINVTLPSLDNSGDDTLVGTAADEFFDPGAGNDSVSAMGGDDTINGVGGGTDLFDGGDGVDTVTYDGALSGVTVDINGGTTTGTDTGDDTLIAIENIIGTDFADDISGDNGDNLLNGGAGDDVIKGKRGADLIYAGDGDDTVNADQNNDLVYGGNGNDRIYGNGGNDELHGDAGDDLLNGGWGNDTLYGDDGIDQLRGHNNNDILYGGDGDDQFWGGNNDDVLFGENGDDVVRGENGVDALSGGEGNDQLYGGNGNDLLNGGTGDDTLTGGTDADVFAFTAGDGLDIITDFEDGVDIIDFSDSGLTFGDLTIVQEGADTTITYAVDGSSNPVDQITLSNTDVSLVDQDDFVFS